MCPFVIADGAHDLLQFLSAAFGASERERITRTDGSIGHAEVQIGDSAVMITDATDRLPPRPSAFDILVKRVSGLGSRCE